MSERTQELRVGVVTLLLSGVAAVMATFGAGVSLPLGASTYQIKIRTDRAPGVGENTPVRKDGVVIGRVASAEFLPEGGVLITADIQPGAPIYQSDTASIRPSSLFGDAVINFSYTEGGPVPPQRLAPGSLVAASSLPDPIEALTSLQVDVGPTIESIGRAATAVEELTTKVNRALGDDFGGAENRVETLREAGGQTPFDFRRALGNGGCSYRAGRNANTGTFQKMTTTHGADSSAD